MQIELINGDAADHGRPCDMVFTDPPFDMPGDELSRTLDLYPADHLVMLTTMRQLLAFAQCSSFRLAFDFVFDGVMPKQSKSRQTPNFVHATGVYMTRPGARSAFSRKRRKRSDVFEANGYWPTIFRAPRDTSAHGMAKNEAAVTDLLGSFDVQYVVDPFAGSGTTGMAAFELGMRTTLIERDPATFRNLKQTFRFLGA